MPLSKFSTLAARIRVLKPSSHVVGRHYNDTDESNERNTEDYIPRHTREEVTCL